MKIEPNKISKIKYVYAIYMAKDELYNCERYPVVYSNKNFLYYAKEKGGALTQVPIKSLRDEYSPRDEIRIDGYYPIYYYYLKVENFDSTYLNKSVTKHLKAKKLKQARVNVELAQKSLDTSMRILNKLERED